jgi:EAL domain-containing protein (putative c-di-GMP-specific phosphodiesterase class I)
VPAAEFVEIAEESGLIEALGQFTVRQAFEDAARWPGLRLAVNISAVQLRQRGFPEWIKSVADGQALDPHRVEIEITERILLGDDPQTHATLVKLRRYGFRIVLDDFGTGYSSLGYLQRYPIDKVKIDRTFVARIGQEEGAEAVVVAIVRLAKALGLDVIAEGVETDAQRLTLAVAGCAEVQGYLTGRPMRAEEIRLGGPDSEEFAAA